MGRVSKRYKLTLPRESSSGTPFFGSPRVTPGLKRKLSVQYDSSAVNCCEHCPLRDQSRLKIVNYENHGFVESPQNDDSPSRPKSVEFDHYGVRRKSIPIISTHIELQLDHNFYNLLIITFFNLMISRFPFYFYCFLP